ncbi:hypothetical protein N7488_010204 [Penicillium malachiteum]|nr:hypothetical protein N7488_010204 [Penicillium malachiteum]
MSFSDFLRSQQPQPPSRIEEAAIHLERLRTQQAAIEDQLDEATANFFEELAKDPSNADSDKLELNKRQIK